MDKIFEIEEGTGNESLLIIFDEVEVDDFTFAVPEFFKNGFQVEIDHTFQFFGQEV
jgi:hypothetical protein